AKNIDVGTIFKQESGKVSYHPFPHHDNDKTEDPRLKSKSLTSHNILVVDDKEVQRTLVNLYLKQLGYSVILANNGKVAIEIIQSNPIDLVFMDIQMPIMDGFKAAKIIRETFPGIPIIALSGESGAEDLLKMEELMDGRLTKPTTKDSLDATLKSVLSKSKTT
uniref:response regulator n=1 Tax=Vibrio caribbeanicus TaxID=701175 RepID=UPI0030DC9765